MRLARSLVAVALFAALAASAAAGPLSGKPLAEALAELQRRGLTLIYSSNLVHPGMIVVEEPRATSPRGTLDEILAPHGLAVREAPGGVLVIVAVPRPVEPPKSEAAPPARFLDQIVVTPSHHRLLRDTPETGQFLSREEVERMPHLADDVYRAVKQVPGTASSDLSAEFNLRGGASDELLVVLDGVELLAPFHLKDFLNTFSTLDSEAIGGVDLLTGGFPAEFGDRMSGVMELAVRSPTTPHPSSIEVGTVNARFSTGGSGADGQSHWLVTGRAWYPDDTLNAIDVLTEEISTDYYDLLGKYQRSIGDRSVGAVQIFSARDRVRFHSADEEETESVQTNYGSDYFWANLFTQWNAELFSTTMLAFGRGNEDRSGGIDDLLEGTLQVNDLREHTFAQVKQDWRYALSQRQFLKFGFDVRRTAVEYDYFRLTTLTEEPEQVDIFLEPEGESYALYAADRVQFDRLIAELGIRWDKQFWTEGGQISPRLNLMYLIGPRTTARAAWGRFAQTQRLTELPVQDGVTTFDEPQLSDHVLVGLEHQFERGFFVRAEGYLKEFDRLRTRYENLFNPVELFPEGRPDRIEISPEGGYARGVELIVKRESGSPLSWWAGYAWSRSVDEIDDMEVPRAWDQRHALTLAMNLALPRRWSVNLTGNWHSGWPTTAVSGVVDPEDPDEVELVYGQRNGERLPEYFRADLRVSKAFTLPRGELKAVFEVMNLTNRENVCCIGDFETEILDDGSVEVVPEMVSWSPLVPSLSLRWEF